MHTPLPPHPTDFFFALDDTTSRVGTGLGSGIFVSWWGILIYVWFQTNMMVVAFTCLHFLTLYIMPRLPYKTSCHFTLLLYCLTTCLYYTSCACLPALCLSSCLPISRLFAFSCFLLTMQLHALTIAFPFAIPHHGLFSAPLALPHTTVWLGCFLLCTYLHIVVLPVSMTCLIPSLSQPFYVFPTPMPVPAPLPSLLPATMPLTADHLPAPTTYWFLPAAFCLPHGWPSLTQPSHPAFLSSLQQACPHCTLYSVPTLPATTTTATTLPCPPTTLPFPPPFPTPTSSAASPARCAQRLPCRDRARCLCHHARCTTQRRQPVERSFELRE